MKPSKRLIINCDDFGQSAPMNAAIMHLLEERKVSSATIMAPAGGFEEAAAWCSKRGLTNIGLHLTLNSEFDALRWTSITGAPSLHDGTGYMPKTVLEFEQHATEQEVMLELQAQYDKVRQAGIDISHVDNHMGSLYGLATGRSFIPQALGLCSKWGLPFRLPRRLRPNDPFAVHPGADQIVAQAAVLATSLGVAQPDYLGSYVFHLQDGDTYESFKRQVIDSLYVLPEDGVFEMYLHPAAEDADMLAHVPSWQKRVWEYRLLLDDDFSAAMKDAGIEMTSYRELSVR